MRNAPLRSECVNCPGCNGQVYPNARECPRCGYQPATNRSDELLGSLVMVSSILLGFGLAALVQVASDETRNDSLVQVATGFWTAASVLLAGVLIGAEVLRRADYHRGRLMATVEDDDRLWARCEWLLWAFAVSLVATAAGVAVLGFFFSNVHGVIACALAVLMLGVLAHMARR